MPSWLSSSRPAKGWHVAFALGCGGLGPGDKGRAHQFCDLMSADCLSDQPRSLLRNRRHQGELEPHEKRTAGVVAMTAAIGAPDANIRRRTAEPSAAPAAATPQSPSTSKVRCVQRCEGGLTSVFLFFIDLPVYLVDCFAHLIAVYHLPVYPAVYHLPAVYQSTLVDGRLFRPQL